MRWKIYLDIFWYKIDMFHNYCVISLLFVMFSVLESGTQCYSVLAFISNFYKFSGNYSFHTHYDVYRTKTIFQNYSNFPQISIATSVNKRFVNTFCRCLFFSEAVLQGVLKNNPTKNKSMPKFK